MSEPNDRSESTSKQNQKLPNLAAVARRIERHREKLKRLSIEITQLTDAIEATEKLRAATAAGVEEARPSSRTRRKRKAH